MAGAFQAWDHGKNNRYSWAVVGFDSGDALFIFILVVVVQKKKMGASADGSEKSKKYEKLFEHLNNHQNILELVLAFLRGTCSGISLAFGGCLLNYLL